MKKIKSGIKGLDQLIDGGFLESHSILVCGAPGTGKTIFGLQFLHNGVKEENANGLYVCIEDHLPKLKFYASQFGWDFDKLHKSKKVGFLEVPIDQRGFKIVDAIAEKAKEINAKRIVIDSLSALSINAKMFDLPLQNQLDPTGTIKGKIMHTAGYTPFEDLSQFTYLFVDRITDIGATTIMITDSPVGSNELTKDGVSEFVCDGIISIKYESLGGDYSRNLIARKMRETHNDEDIHPLEISKNGIVVHSLK